MEIDIHAKSFAGRPVLGPIRLTLGQGQRVAILGPSGIGKTTFLRIVAGLDEDFEGTVTEIGRTTVVFQEPTLLPWRTALENITLPAGVTAEVARALMAEVGLAGKDALYPRQLSLGQQRRLALARAFAPAPSTLLMDEPFASLDAETAGRMLDLTAALLDRAGASLIFVTHDPAEAAHLKAQPMTLRGSPATLS
ncbi:ABC transporter ATP-binding protein [Tabrizicola soli]|uniref:ABC transporter ATP-binding protein n=1 Tax=Tabrizicola soli TaxID=2185115 RepID=A0ABV7DS09_9RHOB|nr:ATP-binding cassette domain-containing protein [Tabrizicola soli]